MGICLHPISLCLQIFRGGISLHQFYIQLVLLPSHSVNVCIVICSPWGQADPARIKCGGTVSRALSQGHKEYVLATKQHLQQKTCMNVYI